MNETYITHINVDTSRNIHDLSIPLSDNLRKHLIITGRNGSGKTSLLNDLFKFLQQVDSGLYSYYANQKKSLNLLKNQLKNLPNDELENRRVKLESSIKNNKKWMDNFGGVEITFSNPDSIVEESKDGEFIIAYFDAKRHTLMTEPKGINKVDLKKKYNISDRANKDFIQYIVNLKADRSFARDDGERNAVEKIDNWFIQFEQRLQVLFDCPTLQLKFDRSNYNFEIIENNKLPFTFNTLADGYSAIISIATELLLRMEGHGSKVYDLQGVVLVDEIETHLHVELQKKVLPFLIDFFPKLQFIVTTHSPFVVSSISNAVICDLEIPLVTDDLSGYSYDALIESYFYSDKYSEEIKAKINRFEALSTQSDLNKDQQNELRQLRNYFAHAPKYLSNELMVKLQQIELNNLPPKK